MTTSNLQRSENKLKTIVESGKPGKIPVHAPDGTHKQVYISKQTINKLKPALETHNEKVLDHNKEKQVDYFHYLLYFRLF